MISFNFSDWIRRDTTLGKAVSSELETVFIPQSPRPKSQRKGNHTQ